MKTELVYGFGINDLDYPVTKTMKIDGKRRQVWICPFYQKWRSMLGRCYSEKYRIAEPTYTNCYVVEEWKYLSKFKIWMEAQDWEGKSLDKDLLVAGNKVYGPDTCVFVDEAVNNFILECNSKRGEWPVGVCFHKQRNKFISSISMLSEGKRKYLGLYNTPQEAHKVWLENKLEQAYILASKETDPRIAKALIERYENYVS